MMDDSGRGCVANSHGVIRGGASSTHTVQDSKDSSCWLMVLAKSEGSTTCKIFTWWEYEAGGLLHPTILFEALTRLLGWVSYLLSIPVRSNECDT